MDELLTTKGDTEYGQHGGNHASCYSSDTATLGKVIEHQSMFPLILSVRIIEGKTLQLRGKKKITYQDGRTTTTTTKKTHTKKNEQVRMYTYVRTTTANMTAGYMQNQAGQAPKNVEISANTTFIMSILGLGRGSGTVGSASGGTGCSITTVVCNKYKKL